MAAREPLEVATKDSESSGSRKSARRSLVAAAVTQGDVGGNADGLDPPLESTSFSARKMSSIFSQHAEAQLAEEDPQLHDTLMNTPLGKLLQALLLMATVSCYIGPGLATNWAKTVARIPDGPPGTDVTRIVKNGGGAYQAESVVFISKLTVFAGCAIGCTLLDRFYPGEGYRQMLFDRKLMLPWLPLGMGYAIADVAENLSGGRVDPATMSVLSQSRLVGTALVLRLICGTSRSLQQWSILTTITLVIIGYQAMESSGARQPTSTMGLICAMTKNTMSILCGVFSQMILKSGKTPIIVQQGQNCLMGAITTLLIVIPVNMYLIYPWLDRELPDERNGFTQSWVNEAGESLSFFGGKPYPSLGRQNLAAGLEKHGYNQTQIDGYLGGLDDHIGWNYKVMVVSFVYIFREFFCTYCTKQFDVLVKNLCNAVAVPVSYIMQITVLQEKAFALPNFVFCMVMACDVLNYALAP